MSLMLTELIDMPGLQILMDRYYAATGIPVGIIGVDGQIYVSSGWQEICTGFHRIHPVTAERCRQSDDYIKSHLNEDSYVQYKCRNGLWDLAMPIIIAGEHVATLFLGQFFYDDEEIDESFFRNQAMTYGFDLGLYLDALRKIPVFTREKVQHIMAFYASFVDFLVSMGLANHRQREVEKTLKVSEQEKSLILDSTMDLVVYHDTDMNILWGNRRTHESVGLQPEELKASRCWEIWHHRTEPCDGCPVVLARDTGEPHEAEISTYDGREWYIRGFPVKDNNGKVEGVVEFCLDITKRKLAERALRESEEKFARAFRNTPSILAISSLADERFIEVNETFERTTGYRREEAIGRTPTELNIWETSEMRINFLHALRAKGAVRDLEANFRTKEGEILVGLVSAEIIEIKGEPCLLVLIRNITERKRMEREIESLNSTLEARAGELEAANRELEAFNYSVSHDLRSPLTAINGFCQLLLEMCGDRMGEQCTFFAHEIGREVEKMDELITTLLDFSNLSRCKITLETVDLSAMAKKVSSELILKEPDRAISFTIADHVETQGDTRLLNVVLENLIGNAWKYTGKRETALIEFGVIDTGGYPTFFVRDNGTGFDMIHVDKLFRPFERLPGTAGFAGHGIGLATVQRIIERHGGRIWAEGVPGSGATFYFTL